MKNFYFVDNETGEDFIVVADTLHDAIHIASAYFEEPQFLREISEYEAEMIGVDTYQKGEEMGEFEIFKKALERTGAKLNIEIWDFDDYTEQLIEDCTHHIAFWFTNEQLTDIDNDA